MKTSECHSRWKILKISNDLNVPQTNPDINPVENFIERRFRIENLPRKKQI